MVANKASKKVMAKKPILKKTTAKNSIIKRTAEKKAIGNVAPQKTTAKTVEVEIDFRCISCNEVTNIILPEYLGWDCSNYGKCQHCGSETLVINYDNSTHNQYVYSFFHDRLQSGTSFPKRQVICVATMNKERREYPEWKEFYETLDCVRKHNDVIPLAVPHPWIRQYMPVQSLINGKLWKFDSSTAMERDATNKHFPTNTLDNSRDITGDNFIYNDYGLAFILDKPFFLDRTEVACKNKIFESLKYLLGIRKLVWLPNFPGKMDYSVMKLHCFANFIENDTLLLRDSHDMVERKYLEKCLKIIKKECPELKVKVMPTGRTGKPKDFSIGIYPCFVETCRAVFVPQYGIPEDSDAMNCIKSHTNKQVIGIDCRGIAKHYLTLADLTKVYWV